MILEVKVNSKEGLKKLKELRDAGISFNAIINLFLLDLKL